MRNFIVFKVAIGILVLTPFIVGCGNAEAIKEYRYPTTKVNLEKAVRKVIKSNPNIYHDSTQENKLDSIMEKARREHSVADSALYHNDGKYHVTLKIKVGQIENSYIFRYQGNEQDWESSSSSGILIVSVRDKYGNSLSQGNNAHKEFSSKTAKESANLFETEFINKIDTELNLKHTIE